ncbi:hypothetical protein [Streptomyces sp. SP18CS02]|uniref:hypothetical protein n=1 Tax=Streptomyces sp. SP18CS02 TaxID=3002531 RepID=UPI002E7848D0|nr:hypothetical protein [Streptomyces sp. SP18CS02]MEE1753418.1 hypothetical protein [Streptomyces sp. SP18CS02]
MAATGEGRAPGHARLVLGVGAIGFVINVVDWFVDGQVRPHDAFPLMLMFWGAADLLEVRRPSVARALRRSAGTLLVAAGLAAGVPAAVALARGGDPDWIDLLLGVFAVLYLAVSLAALIARLRGRRALSS